MPSLVFDTPISSRESFHEASSSDSILEDEYRATSFPGYSEKPLDEQLEPIAVVGMGCRLPGDVGSPADFWDLIMNKRTGNTPKVPSSRFNIDAHFHKNNDRPGSFGVLGGYFLNGDLSEFDPTLFNITPIEAMWMDPQQRKLLEVVYEALESGGISLDAISGTRTAVFAASFTADWQQMSFKEPSFRHSISATGVDPGIISNRISHVFNLNGPSIVCNTACSSSVYALHNACNALRNGEAEGAIVGGVNLIITVDQHMNTAKLGVLSPTSTCHTFDESADGYGRADAVGAVYLKRLSDAVRDGDPIRGVIRSSATNSNGKVPAVGITYPNMNGQADVIGHAYKRGGDLDPRLTGYFECHGTGTAIGDPIEVEAVARAMNKNRQAGEDPLWIGAVKTNIGHSEAASGLSALIKAVLQVERGIIAPTRGLVKPNPKIAWDDWKVKVVTDPVPFPAHLPVKRVSINSFGYGGTNAHIIVEGADSLLKKEQTYKFIDSNDTAKRPRQAPRLAAERKRPYLLPFSAHDKPTLLRNIDAHGKVAHNYDLLDLSYTLANRRSNLSSRAFSVVNYGNLDASFSEVLANFSFAEKKKTPTLGFVFTGQGAQWAQMGAELMKNSRSFLSSIRFLDLALGELHDGPTWSIEDVLLESAETSRVSEAEFSQPLCTAVQIALVQLLESWGVTPKVTVGHSSGEMAAAYAAGLVSAKEAITLAYYRGIVTRDVTTNGAMMAVGLGAEAVAPYLNEYTDKVVIACHNSPNGVTLSGDADALEEVRVALVKEEVFARVVKTNGKAYHSHHMTPVSAKYEKLVRAAKANKAFDLAAPTTAKMVSSVTNSVLPQMTNLDETYWSKNLRSPVLFNQAVQTILTSEEFADVDLLIEIGPHSAMKGPVQQIKTEVKSKVEYVPTLLRGNDCAVQLLSVAGELFNRNYPLDMERVTSAYVEESAYDSKLGVNKGSVIVDLPPYQWNYARPMWAENRASREQRQPKFPRHDLLGSMVIGGSLAEPTWRNVLRTRDLPWLKDHSLGGEVVFPAAAYFAMAMEALTQLNDLSDTPVDIQSFVLRDVSIQKALITPDNDDGIEVMLNLRPSVYSGETAWWDFGVSSVDMDGTIKEHMAGSVAMNARSRGAKPRAVPQSSQRASGKAWNDALRDVGFDYGPTFQDMDDIRFDGKNYWSSCTTNIKTEVDESLGESRYSLHPAAIDSVLQLCIAAIHAGRTNAMEYGAIPIQVDEVTIWPPTQAQIEKTSASAYAWCDQRGIRNFETSAQMTADDGEVVVEITSLRCVSYEAAVPQKPASALIEAPYGEVDWNVDFSSLKTAADIEGFTASDLVNLALFQSASKKVLQIGTTGVEKTLQKNPRAHYTAVVESEEEATTFKESVAGYQNAKVIKLEEVEGLAEGSFDILAIDQTADALPKAWRALKPLGHAFTGFIDAQTGFDDLKVLVNSPSSGAIVTKVKAEANGQVNGTSKRSVQLIIREEHSAVVALTRSALEALGWDVEVSRLDSVVDSGIKDHVIILADFERPLLFTVNEKEFEAVHAIIGSTSSLLWVTTGGLLEGKHPEFAMVQGLARTVTSEQATIDFRTIDVDLENVSLEQVVSSVTEVAKRQAAGEEEIPDREFSLSHGKRYISRLVRNNDLNGLFSPDGPEPVDFKPGSRVSGKVVSGKVVFQEEVAVESELQPGQVEVQVLATGLTKEGVLVITGSDYPITFSHEIGGIVHKVASDVSNLKVGDKVVGFHAGTFSSYQTVPSSLLSKLDDEEDLDSAVSVLTAYSSALYGLQTLAGVEEGEKVLILPNTGTSGVAAVKITQALGGIPYVVAKTEAEVEYLNTQLGVTSENIHLLSDATPVYEQLRKLTGGKGADIVFSSGNTDIDAAREAWRGIARFGRFLDGSRKDVLRRSALYGVPAQRGARYLPFDILDIYEGRPKVLARLIPAVLDLLRDGSILAPGVLQSVTLAGLDKAVAKFSDAFGSSKAIVKFTESETPVKVLPVRASATFSPEYTYLLVGCLGGLGRSLTSWMMKHGARRFTFLSRSGIDAPSAARLVKDIEAAGAIVQVVRGDATVQDDVTRAVAGVPADNPIKGVVHAAMVLRDGLFNSMTYKNWKTAVEPKIAGAANLHAVLANEPLDFFLMTSSVSGVLGNPAQSNYAAANSYLDSLARHRSSAGQTAVSLVLPMVLEVGVVAENNELELGLKRKGMYGIDEEHLLQSFEAGIQSSKWEKAPDHIVVGLDPAKLQKAVSDESVTDSYWLEDARFGHAVHDINSADGAATSSGGGQDILATIKSAASPAEAVEAVSLHLKEKLARMLLLDDDVFELSVKSIASYGIDSMIGAELRKWIFKEFKTDIPFQQLLAATLTITKFATQVCASQGVGEVVA